MSVKNSIAGCDPAATAQIPHPQFTNYLRIIVINTPTPKLLYCRCAYAQVVPQGTKDAVLEKLCASGASFDSVADLCEMAAHRDPRLKAIADSGPLRIAACFPRAVRGLFQQCGFTLPTEEVEILNMRTQTADEVAEAMLKTEA